MKMSYRKKTASYRIGYEWLRARKVKSFLSIVDGFSFEAGAKAMFQSSGIGKLAPNVLMMGFKQDWRTCYWEDLNAYFNVLQYANFYLQYINLCYFIYYDIMIIFAVMHLTVDWLW